MTDSVVNRQNLLAFVERIENLEERKREIADDIKEVYAEAGGTGFDKKTIREIVKLRKLTADERAEQEALLDIYKAALGMLDGTPLGEAAIRKLSEKKQEPKADDPEKPAKGGSPAAAPDIDPPEPEPPQPDLNEARAMGAAAAHHGDAVTTNPFPARDARRAAWDEAWCTTAGSDGMEIPAAFRRAGKKAPSADDRGADK